MRSELEEIGQNQGSNRNSLRRKGRLAQFYIGAIGLVLTLTLVGWFILDVYLNPTQYEYISSKCGSSFDFTECNCYEIQVISEGRASNIPRIITLGDTCNAFRVGVKMGCEITSSWCSD